jgi:hypothetical protein
MLKHLKNHSKNRGGDNMKFYFLAQSGLVLFAHRAALAVSTGMLIFFSNYYLVRNGDPNNEIPGTLTLIFGLIFPLFIGYGIYVLSTIVTKLEFGESQLRISQNGLFKRRDLVLDTKEIAAITVRESHFVFEFYIHRTAGTQIKINTYGIILSSNNWLVPKKNEFAPESSDGDRNLNVAFTIAKSLGVPIHTKYIDSNFDPIVKNQPARFEKT